MSHSHTTIESSKTYPYPRGLAGPEIVDFWGLNGPSYRKAHWKRWGAKPPPGDKDKFWISHQLFHRQNIFWKLTLALCTRLGRDVRLNGLLA